nr:hypothetical protein Iba_chr08eCG8050 [Ipomoea batatas]GME15402.1 hypothetical protein Iba_scaffold16151CG0030 [Ipomoea batatas]
MGCWRGPSMSRISSALPSQRSSPINLRIAEGPFLQRAFVNPTAAISSHVSCSRDWNEDSGLRSK